MNPDQANLEALQDTIVALKGTISALTATIETQNETISYLKWGLGVFGSVIAAESLFFVAWIRTLYDSRQTEGKEQLENRDKLLERVLSACTTLAAAVEANREHKRRG